MGTNESHQPWRSVSSLIARPGTRPVALLGYAPETMDPCLAWATWDEENQRWLGWWYLFPPQYWMPAPELPVPPDMVSVGSGY